MKENLYKKITNSWITSALLLASTFLISIAVYDQLPELMASHWNFAGEADGYSGKFSGAFLMPIVSLAIFFLFLFFPKIDPKKENVAKFIGDYIGFANVFLLFMLYVHVLTIAVNLGYEFNFNRLVAPGFAVLFYGIGSVLPKVKPNWFIGIRTAWTLSSDIVWEKTHLLGGKLFKSSGVLALLGIFFVKYAVFFIILPVVVSAIYLIIYSYLEHRRLVRNVT